MRSALWADRLQRQIAASAIHAMQANQRRVCFFIAPRLSSHHRFFRFVSSIGMLRLPARHVCGEGGHRGVCVMRTWEGFAGFASERMRANWEPSSPSRYVNVQQSCVLSSEVYHLPVSIDGLLFLGLNRLRAVRSRHVSGRQGCIVLHRVPAGKICAEELPECMQRMLSGPLR